VNNGARVLNTLLDWGLLTIEPAKH